MYCKNCGKNIPDSSVFCEFCGNKIRKEDETTKTDTKVPAEKIEINKEIKNEKIKKMASHLEFLGYEIEKLETDENDKRDSIFAKHPNNLDFTLLEVFPDFVILRALMATKKKPSSEIDAFINDMNKVFVISKIYREVEDEIVYLRVESIYTGAYIKDIFAKFMDINIRENNQLRSSDNFSKLFVD